MHQRYIVLTIDTISELLKDYIANEEDLPADAAPIRMLFRPDEKGKLAIEFQSEHIKAGSPPIAVTFNLKRIHAV